MLLLGLHDALDLGVDESQVLIRLLDEDDAEDCDSKKQSAAVPAQDEATGNGAGERAPRNGSPRREIPSLYN